MNKKRKNALEETMRKGRQLRRRANHPLEGSDYVPRGLVFYRPGRAEAGLCLLSREAAKEA